MKLNKKNMKDICLDQKVIKIQEPSTCLTKLMDMKNSLSSKNEISQAQLNASTSQLHEQGLQKRMKKKRKP
ncbi:hypothetical protein TNCV_2441661 [Trichonephila clavipes]|nr:hypothetical protein TNCV_2441661 [Trichonephila clavipes]